MSKHVMNATRPKSVSAVTTSSPGRIVSAFCQISMGAG